MRPATRWMLALHRASLTNFRALRCCREEFRAVRAWQKGLPLKQRSHLRLIGAQCLADKRRARGQRAAKEE